MTGESGVRKSSLAKVAEFLAAKGPGGTFSKLELFEAVPDVSQADRRMRDLRQMGWQIDNYKLNPNLRPDEYLVRKLGTRVDLGERAPKLERKNITGPKRRRILERDGHTCQACGVRAGQEFPDAPGRTAVLTISHIVPVSQGGQNTDDNLRTECQRCSSPSNDPAPAPPSTRQVLDRASQRPFADKQLLYSWMKAGQRTTSETEELFYAWSRLAPADRTEVMAALADEIINELTGQ
ncbi:HNH endonuclease [Streptomyces sp. NPDC001480]|uniref:HNH endonuclease n=1 Tax=Streptomyces sp. NPDC001480 TaxID=3364577 RepID=UPI003680630D